MINYTDYIQCIQCSSRLKKNNTAYVCGECGSNYRIIEDRIVKMIPGGTSDVELSSRKWDSLYEKQLKDGTYENEYENYKDMHLGDVKMQLEKETDLGEIVYLEIGCGPFFLGQNLAKKCSIVIGIDFSLSALKIAKKMLDDKGIENYLLIQGDILNLPIKSNVVDLIYGGGVIEHFRDTQKCINELYRTLKKDGLSFNTVPYLNIGSLTYRQVWGNIPNLPVLRQIAEFVHIKLLKGKHMIFGYEMSFLGSTLKKVHRNSGFQKIRVEKFDVKMSFDFAPKYLKKSFIWLAENSCLFWPMVKVIGRK